jgi:signal transduction histidine kinase
MPEGRSIASLVREFAADGGVLQVWGRSAAWQIKLRWFVPPLLVLGVLAGRLLGFESPAGPIFLLAGAILVYNLIFAGLYARGRRDPARERQRDRYYAILQVTLDYAAMFVLIFFTGGVASPAVCFFVFHVVIAGIQFRRSAAYLFAGIATVGLWTLLFLEQGDLLTPRHILFEGSGLTPRGTSTRMMVVLGFFSVSLLVVAAMTTQIMNRLRARVADLSRTTNRLALLNARFNSLYAMLRAIGKEQRLEPLLKTVTEEMATALNVRGLAVKLLSEDRKTVRFVATHGLPRHFVEKQIVQLAQSPLNRKVIEGETFVHGRIGAAGGYELPEDLIAMGIQSVVFAPLVVEGRVIGILGAYHTLPDSFDRDDSSFFALAAELVAVAIENARSYEAIQLLMKERAKFMLKVAHNMRAPIGASLSMLELLTDEYFGQVPAEQREVLARVEHRLVALNRAIGELLAIGQARDRSVEIADVRVNLNQLAARIEQTFQAEAGSKGLHFHVEAPAGLPEVDSGGDLLAHILENLVSNAIRYTPGGGKVELSLGLGNDGEVRIIVKDTGIGIPASEQERLGTEFFRASNARAMDADGTGLGLAFVKQAVERHHGRMGMESTEGKGTTVTIDLPIRQAPREAGGRESGQ